jgi:ribokinase
VTVAPGEQPDPLDYLAVGDLGVDSVAMVERLPRADDKLWVEQVGDFPGGMMGNCVATAASLGASTAVVALLGDDARGALVLDALNRRGVDTRHIRVIDAPTFWTLSLTVAGGDRSLLQFPTRAFGADWEGFDRSRLTGVRWVHTVAEQGDPVGPLLREAKAAGASTSLDIEFPYVLRPDLPELLASVDVAFCNGAAAAELGGPAAAAVWLRQHGAGRVVVTMGDSGALVCDIDGSTRGYPARAVDAVDTNGAGDAFAAAFAVGALRGWDTDACAQLAVFVAAESTTVLGGFGPATSPERLREKAVAAGYDWGDRL